MASGHGLVQLVVVVDWERQNELFATLFIRINAILSAAWMNFSKRVKAADIFLRQFYGLRFGTLYGDRFTPGLLFDPC